MHDPCKKKYHIFLAKQVSQTGPVYAGGVEHVLEAYRRARDRTSVPRLIVTLKKLGHVYPYQQAIGSYMERSKFSKNRFERLRQPGMELASVSSEETVRLIFRLGGKRAAPRR